MAPHTIVLVDAVIFFFSQFSSRQPGYKQMKVLRQERNTVCFIEFEVISYTTAMMLFLFPTKLEYARTNFIRNHQKTKININ